MNVSDFNTFVAKNIATASAGGQRSVSWTI